MVKLTYTSEYARLNPLYTFFSDDTAILVEWKSQALLFDSTGGEYLAFLGEDIEYGAGAMTGGTIHEVVFRNPDGGKEARITGLDADAGELSTIWNDGGIRAVVETLLAGKDTIKGANQGEWIDGYDGNDHIDGRGGDDWILGSEGRDRLTGGKGSDYFIFFPGDGKDTIVDFDADGGEGHQDFINVSGVLDPEIVKDGKDTLVIYGEDDVIRLLGVAKSHVTSDGDFIAIN
jgi:Ca2+-binding RTX toxin-like protein